MLHDLTNVLSGILHFQSGSMAYYISHAMLNFSASDSSQSPGLYLLKPTLTVGYSVIIEQDLTLVIRVVNLRFDFANPFRLVVTHFNLSLPWLAVIHEHQQQCIPVYTHNFRSVQVPPPTIQQASDKFNYSVILRMEDSACETKQ